MPDNIIMMTTLELRTSPPFSTLFPIKEQVFKNIVQDMKRNGYDYAHPVTLWGGHRATVIDGNTRLKAALELGLTQIPVVLKPFRTEEEALQYAIKSQSNRRNLTDTEILSCLNELDKRLSTGRRKECASQEAHSKIRSSEKTADLLGISRAKVERARAVKDYGSDDVKEAINNGSMSINKAYHQIMQERKGEIKQDKNDRLNALERSIAGLFENRINKEIQDYSNIEYSSEEKEILKQKIAVIINKNIDLLPSKKETN